MINEAEIRAICKELHITILNTITSMFLFYKIPNAQNFKSDFFCNLGKKYEYGTLIGIFTNRTKNNDFNELEIGTSLNHFTSISTGEDLYEMKHKRMKKFLSLRAKSAIKKIVKELDNYELMVKRNKIKRRLDTMKKDFE